MIDWLNLIKIITIILTIILVSLSVYDKIILNQKQKKITQTKPTKTKKQKYLYCSNEISQG
jgi:uncharacterized protein YpmB